MMAQFMTTASEALVSVESELERLRQGDLEALTGLVDRYQGRLYRYLLRLVREQATAEDLFQQTWVRVMERIKSYDPKRNFESWFFAVARNLALDHLRRYQPQSLDEPLPSGDTREDLLPGSGAGALEALVADERAALLTGAMEGLALIHREVLTLRFEEEMKLEEIAKVLGVPLSTVKSRLHRGLLTLRELLETKLTGGQKDA